MAVLQIPDLDQGTFTGLRRWAADRGRTVEDEARAILQEAAAQFEAASSGREAAGPLVDLNDSAQSRGAASLEPMTLSAEDAEAMDEAWKKGLARPKIAIAPLPPYEG
jgi:plasmid stability protein